MPEQLGPTDNIVCERKDEEVLECRIDPDPQVDYSGKKFEVGYVDLSPSATEWTEFSPDTMSIGLNKGASCEYHDNEDIQLEDQLVCGI